MAAAAPLAVCALAAIVAHANMITKPQNLRIFPLASQSRESDIYLSYYFWPTANASISTMPVRIVAEVIYVDIPGVRLAVVAIEARAVASIVAPLPLKCPHALDIRTAKS
jgi:hypothetical protein